MYICVCNALTESDIRSAETAGAATHGEVFRHFGVRPQCGRCFSSMRGMMGCSGACGERRHADDAVAVTRMTRRDGR
ncbi:(2Fe-2S)-binding protein [Telmatospirillum siberiense]|uniref:(2Fe-2S)-binding protein n=2 Tax=Telmatospirillum siberiense TaxID=382514 RepID=A0A2N3PZU8_9PROT|nr:(2Fe-2S)-binding protein [Telmatospirillum siberiense]